MPYFLGESLFSIAETEGVLSMMTLPRQIPFLVINYWAPSVVGLTLPIAQNAAGFTLHHCCFTYEHFLSSTQIQVNFLTHTAMLTAWGENDTVSCLLTYF